MRLTAQHLAVLQAVRNGADGLMGVVYATDLDIGVVLTLARELRGAPEGTPLWLCALDGEPWALTMDGVKAMEVLR